MKQQIISLLEQAKENGMTIGDVLVEVRGMAAPPVADMPLGWKICFTDRDGHRKTVLHGHNAIGDYRDIDPMASCIPLGPFVALPAERAPVGDERAAFDPEVLAEKLRDVAASHFETAIGFGISRDNFERCATDAAKIAQDMASAPVADEPLGWSGWACQYPGKLPRLYGAREIAELNCDLENGDRMLFLSEDAAPQVSTAADGRDTKDAARYRLAVRDCILILRGDAALGRSEWDQKLDALAAIAAQQGEGGGV